MKDKVRWCSLAALYRPGTENTLPHVPSVVDGMLNRKQIAEALGGSVDGPEERKAARRIAMRTNRLLKSEQVTDGRTVAKPEMLLGNLNASMMDYAELVYKALKGSAGAGGDGA